MTDISDIYLPPSDMAGHFETPLLPNALWKKTKDNFEDSYRRKILEIVSICYMFSNKTAPFNLSSLGCSCFQTDAARSNNSVSGPLAIK